MNKKKIEKKNQYQNTASQLTWYHLSPSKSLLFQSAEIIRTSLQFSHIHGTVQALSPAELQRNSVSIFLPALAVCWLPLQSWNTRRENHANPGASDLGQLMPSMPVFYPRPSSKWTTYFWLKNTLSTLLCRAALWFSCSEPQAGGGHSHVGVPWAGTRWGNDLIDKASTSLSAGKAPAQASVH